MGMAFKLDKVSFFSILVLGMLSRAKFYELHCLGADI